MQKALDEFRSAIITGFLSVAVFFVTYNMGFESVAFWSSLVIIILHYSWTRNFNWFITCIHAILTFGILVFVKYNIVFGYFSKTVHSADFFSLPTKFLRLTWWIPLIHFISFICITPTIKLLLDRITSLVTINKP